MKRSIIISLCMIFIMSLLGACGSGSGDTLVSETETPVIKAEEGGVTVTFYDGDSVLKTETIASGKTVAEFIPEKDGNEFVGWFSTPSRNHYFDFSNAIIEDTSIFAGFSMYQEDIRDFFIVGSGKSVLLVQSGWGATVNEEMKLSKTAGKNEYTITTDLLKGDQFQLAMNGSWENQRGFGYIVEKNLSDGTPVFSGDGGFGDASAKNKNITVELDGNYTITLTTYPADDFYDEKREGFSDETKENYNQGTYDTITWVRNGDVQTIIETETVYYIKGETITGWDDIYDDSTRMVNDGSGKHWLTVYLFEDEPFLFTSMVKSGATEAIGSDYLRFNNLDEAGQILFAADPENYNLCTLLEGVYTFIYNADTETLSVFKTTFFIKGETVTDWKDVYDDTTIMNYAGDGKMTMTASLLGNEPFLFTSIFNNGEKDSTGSIYLKYGYLDEAGQELFNDKGGDIVAKATGNYTFIYELGSQSLTATLD